MRTLGLLTNRIRSAAVLNPEVQSSPACVLWPDHDRQWESVIPRLQSELPELFVLGSYDVRPFLSAPDVGKRGAGVLRDKPNINWNKDRGMYHVFTGDRINDYHLSLEDKKSARKKDC